MRTHSELITEANTPHTFYIIKMSGDTGEAFCKLGITKNDVTTRFRELKKYNVYKEISFTFRNAILARGFESLINQSFVWKNKLGITPSKHFGGYTECFQIEYFDEIVFLVKELIFNSTSTIEDRPTIFESFTDDELFEILLEIEEVEREILEAICEDDILFFQYEDDSFNCDYYNY